MAVAILTKFIGPTNHKGSRIKAYTESKVSITVSWDHALNVEQNHAKAAQALAEKMQWNGTWVGGGTREGYAYVNVKWAKYGCSFEVPRHMEAANE